MATIRERDSGYFQAIVRKKGHPVTSRTFRTKTQAQAWAQAVEADIDRGIFQSVAEAERTTLGDLIKRFETEFAPHHYRERDDKKEAWRFQCAQLREALGAYSLSAIDQKLIAKYRDGRLAGGDAKRRAVGESTVRKELYMLSKLFDFAQKEGGINLPRGNPVERIRMPTEGNGRDRRLNADDWKKLEGECTKSRNPWLAAAVTFAVETAMRQGEMLSLDWSNIDKTRRLALLLDPDKIKTGEARAVPLSSRAVAALEKLPRNLKGKIFPVERMTLYHAFRAACRRAEVKDFTWHDLRHEALSRLAERGDFSVLELAAVSGHKTLQMLKRYTHLQAAKLAEKMG